MKIPEWIAEPVTILFATAILATSYSFKDTSIFWEVALCFFIIIILNVLTKKITAYYYEANLKTKFWAWYQFGFAKKAHFKKPIPMLWLPLILSFFTKGLLNFWFGILEFDVKARTERVSRRHGLYRFAEMTDWHIAIIAVSGIVINIIAAIISYIAGFELFTQLSIFYASWALVPLSSLDGSKIFFGSKKLWLTMLIIVGILLAWGLIIS
jgi:hypothetical protein